MSDETLNFKFKIELYNKSKSFGPGIAELLTLIDETGSIKSACTRMGMAYSKAWKIIKNAQDDLGFNFLEGKSGGINGGYSSLTTEGREFLKNYNEFISECNEQISILFENHFFK